MDSGMGEKNYFEVEVWQFRLKIQDSKFKIQNCKWKNYCGWFGNLF
jgi:hypothetical protein